MLAKPIGTVAALMTTYAMMCTGSAHAEILITTATISQGELVIVGRVRRPREPRVEIKISPSKTVKVESTSTGGFRWIGPEFPSTCIVKITSGPDTRDVVIQNCGLPGPPGPAGPPGPPGPAGPIGPKGS
jgi:hypothetical protein